MEVDIDGVQPDEEICEDLFLVCRDVTKEGILQFGTGGEWAEDRYVEFEGLGIDITNIHTTGCGEEEGISVASRCDTDVVFRIGGMRKEGLDDERAERSRDGFDLDRSKVSYDAVNGNERGKGEQTRGSVNGLDQIKISLARYAAMRNGT